jgi:hypothetical protein
MSGQIAFRQETIPASGVVNLANANFVFVISSTVAIALKLTRNGIQRGANTEDYGSSILSGLQISRTQRWDLASITGAAGGVVTLLYGYTDVREDITQFNQQIATVSGIVSTAIAPSSVLADTVDTAQAAGTQTVISANLSRRRITIGVLSTSAGNVRVAQTGGDTHGIEIQAGTFTEFDTTAALTVRCITASPGTATWYALEET